MLWTTGNSKMKTDDACSQVAQGLEVLNVKYLNLKFLIKQDNLIEKTTKNTEAGTLYMGGRRC